MLLEDLSISNMGETPNESQLDNLNGSVGKSTLLLQDENPGEALRLRIWISALLEGIYRDSTNIVALLKL